jgi:hypothetical protein
VTLDVVLQVVDGLGVLSLPYEFTDFLLFDLNRRLNIAEKTYLWHTDQKVCEQSIFGFEVTVEAGNSLW